MINTINILNIFLPLLYMATFTVYALDFFKEKLPFRNSKRIYLLLTIIIHIFYLLIRTFEFNHPPITNKFEIFSVLAFSIAFSYFILELLTDIRRTGLFIILISIVFQVISSLFISHNYFVPEVLRNRLLGLHVVSALLGYSGFALSAVYGILFLTLYRNIKSNKFGLFFNRLPNLEILEQLSFYSSVIGFILLTIAIVIGIIWLPLAFPDFSFSDPKLVSTLFIWILYGAGIFSKIIARWYGKKVILFSLAGFGFVILSLILTGILAKTFHSFY